MPCRKAELKSTTPLKRTGTLARQKPLERATAKPNRQRYTGPSKAVKDLLKARSGGVCEYCGLREATEAHHRLGRKAGGTKRPWINELSNLVDLDLWCHAKITNTNGRRDDYENAGFLLREGMKPAATPIEHARLGRVLLLDDGDTRPAPRKAA